MDVKVRSHVTFVFVSPLTHSLCCVTIDACLPPANEVWDKVTFLHLSVILCTGGGVWSEGGVWSKGLLVQGTAGPGGEVWSQGGPGPGGVGVPGGDPLDGYCCGRYASYWNTFLLIIRLTLILAQTLSVNKV